MSANVPSLRLAENDVVSLTEMETKMKSVLNSFGRKRAVAVSPPPEGGELYESELEA